jgi:hypothetical protein
MIEEITIDEVDIKITEEIIAVETAIEDITEAGTRVETKGIETKDPQERKEEIEMNKTKMAIGMIEIVETTEMTEMNEMAEMTEMTDMTETKGLKEMTGTKGTIVAVIGTIVAVIGAIVMIEDLLEEKETLILIESLERMIETITNQDPNMKGNSKIGKKELPNSLKSTKSVQEMITSTWSLRYLKLYLGHLLLSRKRQKNHGSMFIRRFNRIGQRFPS